MKLAPFLALVLLAAPACGGDDDPPAADAPVGGADAAAGSDAGTGAVRLIEADWSLDPGTEVYWCVRQTVTEDMYVNAFLPIGPLGTHHTVLSIETGGANPDGAGQCSQPFEFGNAGLIFTSGKGTDQL